MDFSAKDPRLSLRRLATSASARSPRCSTYGLPHGRGAPGQHVPRRSQLLDGHVLQKRVETAKRIGHVGNLLVSALPSGFRRRGTDGGLLRAPRWRVGIVNPGDLPPRHSTLSPGIRASAPTLARCGSQPAGRRTTAARRPRPVPSAVTCQTGRPCSAITFANSPQSSQ